MLVKQIVILKTTKDEDILWLLAIAFAYNFYLNNYEVMNKNK